MNWQGSQFQPPPMLWWLTSRSDRFPAVPKVLEKAEGAGAEDGTSHFYELSPLISTWKGLLGWGSVTLFSHPAGCGSDVPCLHTWQQPSCPQDREESKLKPLHWVWNTCSRRTMGAIPRKKPARQPCLQLTDLQAWLKTSLSVCSIPGVPTSQHHGAVLSRLLVPVKPHHRRAGLARPGKAIVAPIKLSWGTISCF